MASFTKDRGSSSRKETQQNKKWIKLAIASKQKWSMHGNAFSLKAPFSISFAAAHLLSPGVHSDAATLQ